MKKTLLFFLLALSLSAQDIVQKVGRYQKSESLNNAQWSVYAKYVESGEVIVDHNGSWSLTPASGLKLISTAFALDVLGSDYRFETILYADGNRNGYQLNGDLLIFGGADPTLGSNTVKGSLPLDSLMLDWLKIIQSKGIKKINGNIIAYTGLFSGQNTPGNWYWIDIGNYYGAAASTLNINDNLYYLYFKPGKTGGPAQVLRTEPEIPGLTFTNYMLTGKRGSGDNGYIYNTPKQYNATLRGTIPAGVNEFSIKGSIPDPPLFAAQHLKEQLQENGISVSGEAGTKDKLSGLKEERVLKTTLSPPLKDIVYQINKRSNNLYTEAVTRMASLKISGQDKPGSHEKAVEEFLDKLKVRTDGLALYDACGLSPANTISAQMMTEMLAAMTRHSEFDTFYNSLAVAGDPDDPGFFSNWGSATAMANNARVKSGLISRVRSHSGYIKDKQGRMIAFSMIANNYSGSLRSINNMHKNLIIALAELR